MIAAACGCSLNRRGFLRGLGASAAIAPTLCRPAIAQGERRIDVHHHLLPPTFAQVAKSRGLLPPVIETLDPQRSLADMDQNGVETAVLSIPSPGVWYDDIALARRLARECNEYNARLRDDHPGRFGMFATLPIPDVEGALAETAYALDTLKADGVHMWTSYGDKWLGHPLFTPLLEELNRRKAVVYTHPTTAACCNALVPEAPAPLIEYGTDTTRTIASLVFSGATNRFSDIRWIFSHAGGTMPFLVERFTFQAAAQARTPAGAAKIPNGVLPELKRLYFDTAQSANPFAMGPLARLVGADHILLGTDFPYRTTREHVEGLATCGAFGPEELRGIQRDNAVRLLPRLG